MQRLCFNVSTPCTLRAPLLNTSTSCEQTHRLFNVKNRNMQNRKTNKRTLESELQSYIYLYIHIYLICGFKQYLQYVHASVINPRGRLHLLARLFPLVCIRRLGVKVTCVFIVPALPILLRCFAAPQANSRRFKDFLEHDFSY